MILPSTIRKLQAKGANVFRVTIPAHTVTLSFGSQDFPECRDYFASSAGAATHAANANPAQWGVKGVEIRIDSIPASALDPLFGCEVTS